MPKRQTLYMCEADAQVSGSLTDRPVFHASNTVILRT